MNEFYSPIKDPNAVEEQELGKNSPIPLMAEKDANGEPIPGEAQWLTLKAEGRVVEGKMFQPAGGSKKLVFFEPGMPGDSNTWMEGKHVPKLVEAGYAVFCARHSGSQINSERSPELIKCPERIEAGKVQGQEYIGGDEPATVEDIDREPEIALKALSADFDEIYLVGHSSGAAAELYSMTNLPGEITDKIRSFTSLSGFIGEYDHEADTFDREGRFDSEGLRKYYEYCNQYLNMGDAGHNVELAKSVLERIYSHPLPEHIQVNLITSPKDEYVTPDQAGGYHDFIGRGLRVRDKTQDRPDYHDLKNLTPETLIRLIEIYHPESTHNVTVGNKNRDPFDNKS
ncbi:MAG: alpha/beta fold hydrolase [Patescibacteria group bacterium]|jgi:hypothetical protein